MIMQLALGQHSRALQLSLERDFRVAEALFKQHIRLQASGRMSRRTFLRALMRRAVCDTAFNAAALCLPT